MSSCQRSTWKHLLRQCGPVALILALVLIPRQPVSGLSNLTRTHTETISFPAEDRDDGRLTNAQIAFQQMQAFLDSGQFQHGVDYSFNRDVLHDALARKLGYVTTKYGYGDGVNRAASLLNALVHQAKFWHSDGTEKPVFEQVQASPLKNDRTLGAYAVQIYLDPAGVQSYDYVWRLNEAYDGPPPRIAVNFDGSAAKASLTVTYADDIAAPSGGTFAEQRDVLARTLRTMIGDRRLGVSIIPLDNPQDEIGINQDAQVPSASSWKGGGMLYFFENISPDVWRSVPIRYWNLRNVLRVPPEYRQVWLKYHEILRWVYVMTVFSGNHEAANVLYYVYQNATSSMGANPIIAFNNWCMQYAGTSSESGQYSWQYGNLDNPGYNDPRLGKRRIVYNGEDLFYSSTFSARDLALFYYHLATVGRERGYYDAAVELLSIRTSIVSKIEGQVVDHPEIQTATKDGYFSPTSENSLGHDVNNDAGLLIFPDGKTYAVAFTAFDAVDIESDVVGVVVRTLAGIESASAPKP